MNDKNAQLANKIIEAKGEGAVDFLLSVAAQEDSVEGFAAFFELLHGPPLHSEGEKWIRNAYEAHKRSMGLAQECHREAGKTTVFSKFFLAFRIGHEPEKTNAIIRITEKKGRITAAGVASIIENDPRWKQVFPNIVPDYKRGWGQEGYFVKRDDMDYDEWQKIRTEQPDEPTFVGYGYESGSVIGSRFNGVIIVDDIQDENNTRSKTELAKVYKFVQETLEYCRMQGAWEIWNFTPWTLDDVYSWIKGTGQFIVSKSPVYIEADEDTEGASYWEPMPLNLEFPDAGDIPLSGKWYIRYDPIRWGWERIAEKYRRSGPIGFARMMLLDLEATKGMMMRDEWLHKYPSENIENDWMTYIGVDYAEDQDGMGGGDPFALAVGAVLPGGGLIAPIDGYVGHLTKAQGLQKVVEYCNLYPNTQLVGVEAIGEGRGFYSDLMLMNDVHGRPIPLFKIAGHTMTKRPGKPNNRYTEWLAPRYQAGRIRVPSVQNEFVRQFIDQWLIYPNGAHDDILDAVYMLTLAAEGELADRTIRKHGTMLDEKVTAPFSAFGKRRRGRI